MQLAALRGPADLQIYSQVGVQENISILEIGFVPRSKIKNKHFSSFRGKCKKIQLEKFFHRTSGYNNQLLELNMQNKKTELAGQIPCQTNAFQS